MAPSIIQLKCQCKNDPWGKKGSESRAARYAAQAPGTDFKIDEDTEYSEVCPSPRDMPPSRSDKSLSGR